MHFLIVFGSLYFAVSTVLLPYFYDYWCSDTTKKAFADKTEQLKIQISNLSERDFLLAQMSALSALSDKFYGSSLISRRVVQSVERITCVFVLTALLLRLLNVNAPLAMNPAPWEVVSIESAIVQAIEKSAEGKQLDKLTPDIKIKVNEYSKYLFEAETPPIRVCYRVFYITGIFLCLTGLNICSLVLARLTLREIATGGGYFSVVAFFFFNAVCLGLFLSVALFVLSLIALPALYPVISIFIYIFPKSIYWAFAFLLPFLVLACFFATPWMKTVVLFSLIPSLIVLVSLLACLLLYPIKRHIYLGTFKVLVRSLEFKDGPLKFFLFSSLALTALLAALYQIF